MEYNGFENKPTNKYAFYLGLKEKQKLEPDSDEEDNKNLDI